MNSTSPPLPVAPCQSILIVEDSEDVRETLTDFLLSEGYEVHATANGREALDYLHGRPHREEPALILLDLMMPEMNGWEFLDARRKESETDASMAGHRVVTISAVSPQVSLEDPTPLPVDSSVPKPISIDCLMRAVRTFCSPAPAIH